MRGSATEASTPSLRPGSRSGGERVSALRRRGRRRRTVVLTALALLVLVLLGVDVLLGTYTVTIADFVRLLGGADIPGARFIVMENKLPRALVGLLAGVAFGVGGSIFQTMLRNPLASPDIIGISFGASAAAVTAIVLFGAGGVSVSVAAVGGALAVATLISVLARGRGGAGLILTGIGTAAFLQAVVTFVLSRADITTAQDAMIWLTGSLNPANWNRVVILGLALAILLPVTVIAARQLAGMQVGADTAAGLGFNVPAGRVLLTVLGVLLVAVATAAAGPLAFVAFLSGPIAKRLNHGVDTPALSALVGAVLVLGADFLAANAVPGQALPTGVVTGALGAPFLLWLLITTHRNDQGISR